MRVVYGRHEQGVVGMADGYARFTGRAAVATVTQGPGLTNTATSLVVARRRHSPVLLLAGEAPLGDLHNPQGFDQLAFGQLMAGQAARIQSVLSLDELLARALGTLRAGLPFMLSLPADVQRAELGGERRYRRQADPCDRSRSRSLLTGPRSCSRTPSTRSCWLAGAMQRVGPGKLPASLAPYWVRR